MNILPTEIKQHSDFMLRTLNYMKIFWKQIVVHRNDAEYSIGSTVIERTIRPITSNEMEAYSSKH